MCIRMYVCMYMYVSISVLRQCTYTQSSVYDSNTTYGTVPNHRTVKTTLHQVLHLCMCMVYTYLDVLEFDLGVPMWRVIVPEHMHGTQDGDTGKIHGTKQHRLLLVSLGQTACPCITCMGMFMYRLHYESEHTPD